MLLAYANVLIAVPLNWYLAWRLWSISWQHPSIGALRERAFLAVHLAIVVTIFAIVFLNNGMEQPILDVPTTQLITRAAILSLTIPALRWLWLYRQDH